MIHRDDMDFEEVEKIEEAFSEAFPGCKVVFAGDCNQDEMPQEVLNFINKFNEKARQSFLHGQCLHCGAEMSDYRPHEDGWSSPEGWNFCETIGSDSEAFWECPLCGHEDQAESGDES